MTRYAFTLISLILCVSCKSQGKPAALPREVTTPATAATADAVRPIDTEAGSPMAAERALKSLKLPDGFTATLFASEPLVRQPIDLKVDARGRVWVAEAYWYPNESGASQDRITLLEDTDGDGVADKRTIFAHGLDYLTSIEIGFGGVWALAPPNLVFYPDANLDGIPDGPPRIHVMNWNTHGAWNMANGLSFGPDGWLYGREGQIGTSSPVSSKGSRPPSFSAGIWRYHPVSGKLEIVAQGMTNPWGLDWNDDGEMFVSGNCNGHLWHIVGGSLYQQGFGSRGFSSEFGRTPPIEVAPHYEPDSDWYSAWQVRFENQSTNDRYGGGHSHCGLVICNGSAWPEAMRGHTLMSNIHGNRINQDTIEPHGSSYLSRRVGDPVKPADSWFRGVSLVPAADGALFISDWSDTGECHDKSGIDQNSGRIFRLIPMPLKPLAAIDRMPDPELLKLLADDREEPARQALRELQARGLNRKLAPGTREAVLALLAAGDFRHRLRALSTLHGGGLLDDAALTTAAGDADERVRAMAVRYWAEGSNPDRIREVFHQLARKDPSPRVQLHLASVTRLLPPPLASAFTTTLIGREKNLLDERGTRLLWHIQVQNPAFSVSVARSLIAGSQSPAFTNDLARFLIENDSTGSLETIFRIASTREHPAPLIAAAITTAREHWQILPSPPWWPELRTKWMASPDNDLRGAALSAAILFGDREALDALSLQITDPKATLSEKVAALETLAVAQTRESTAIVTQAFRAKELRIPAIHALRHFKQPAIAASLIENWPGYDDAERHAIIETLVSRKEWALSLLEAMAPDRIPASFLTTTQARNLAESGDPLLRDAVLKRWGTPSRSTPEKEAAMARANRVLAGKAAGDPTRGRLLFAQSCGPCHTLYGEGGKLGPDLTGRNRADLPALLHAIVDPSAEVPEDGRLTIVTLTDGTLVSGVITAKNEAGMTLLSQQGEVPVKTAAIANVRTQATSPMPEGLLDRLTDPQLADLLAYLRADQTPSSK